MGVAGFLPVVVKLSAPEEMAPPAADLGSEPVGCVVEPGQALEGEFFG